MSDYQTLGELIGWTNDPQDVPTGMIRRVLKALRTPPSALDVEDLRQLVSQEVGLEHTLPRALAVLERSPFAEGDLHAGDLLNAVLGLGAKVWADHPGEAFRAQTLVADIDRMIEDTAEAREQFKTG